MKALPLPIIAKRRSQGTALLIALAAVAVLITILTVSAHTQQIAFRTESNRMQLRRARLMADNAVQFAEQILAEGNSGLTASGNSSTASATTGVTNTVTTLLDDWALVGASGTTGQASTVGSFGDMTYTVGADSFRLQIVDTCSLVDINLATTNQLLNLGLTQQLADCLTDFRSAGETAKADGAKDDYYNNLANPYNAKLAPFTTFDELLQVEGFTPDIVYDPQNVSSGTVTLQTLPNGRMPALSDLCTAYAYAPLNTASGNPRTNVDGAGLTTTALTRLGFSSAGAATILSSQTGTGAARHPNWATLGALIARLTNRNDQTAALNTLKIGAVTRKEGLININTATQNVLETIPNITPDVAASIVTQQGTGFATLGAITSVPGMTSTILRGIADSVCVVSSTFELRILATAGGTSQPYVGLVQVVGGVPQLISLGPAPFGTTEQLARWGWSTDATSTTDLVDAQ